MSIHIYRGQRNRQEQHLDNDNGIELNMEQLDEMIREQRSDERDVVINTSTKISKDDIYVPRPTSDWEITTHFKRNRYDTSYMKIESDTKQNVYNEKTCDEIVSNVQYNPRKTKKIYICGKKQTVVENEMYHDKYKNEQFLDWQNDLSDHIHKRHHLILDISTSCGKTYATVLCVVHEILSRNDRTCLFVLPNEEVMREVYSIIVAKYRKSYKTKNMRLCSMQSKHISTADDTHVPNTQLMCTTIENFVDFVTNPVNSQFVNKLEYIVFDEVHMKLSSRCLWWKRFLPIETSRVQMSGVFDENGIEQVNTIELKNNCAIITLSATIGDIDQLKDKMWELAGCCRYEIVHLNYKIRPIPLQYMVYMGSHTPTDGLISVSQKDKEFNWVNFIPNIYDPTQLDTQLLVSDDDITPEIDDTIRDMIVTNLKHFNREKQYAIGQQISQKIGMSEYLEYRDSQLNGAITSDEPRTIYNLLSSLFTHDLAPVMIFDTEGYKIKRLVNGLIKYIDHLEANDPEIKDQIALYNKLKKDEKRLRDRENDIGLEKISKIDVHRGDTRNQRDNTGGKSSASGVINSFKMKEELKRTEEILKSKMYRWRFPCIRNELQKVSQIVKDALDYGIGIYTTDMSTPIKYMMFNMFKEGTIKLLISDTSIAHGINLPIRTVILLGSANSYTPNVFQQISGRAGRFGYDTCGYVVSMFDVEQQKQCYNENTVTTQLTFPKLINYYELIRLHVNNPDWNYYLKGDLRQQMIERYLDYVSHSVSDSIEHVNQQIELIKHKKLHQHQFTGMNQMMRDENGLILTELLSNIDTCLIIRDMSMGQVLDVLNYILCGRATEMVEIEVKIKNYIDQQFSMFNFEDDIYDHIEPELLINMIYDRPQLLNTITKMEVIQYIQYMFRWIMTIKKYLQSIIPQKHHTHDKFLQNIIKIDEKLYYNCVKYSI